VDIEQKATKGMKAGPGKLHWNMESQKPEATAPAPVNGDVWKSPATGIEFVWIKELKMWVGKYEVTNGEYRKKEPGHNSGEQDGNSLNGERQPVGCVSFDDAKAYAKWLTERDRTNGSLPAGYYYRLPSDKEWMTFAQCGDGRGYPWGNNWPPRNGHAGNYADSSSACKYKISGYRDGHNVSCDVKDSWSNSWGLYGVGGNVWECCAESSSIGSAFGAWRGASWDVSDQGSLRCSYRVDDFGSFRVSVNGFRLVLSR
jgi:formylglycine-generating enzyme required for sulfatase activity